MVLQVFGNADTVVGAAKDDGVLQEHAARHEPAEQGEHRQAFCAEQGGTGEEPERQVLGLQVAEKAHALVHEDQEAEGCGPGDEHHAETQQGAEHLLAVDAGGLEDDDAEDREEAEESTECAASGQIHECKQQQSRQDGREAVYQANAGEEVIDETRVSIFKGSN